MAALKVIRNSSHGSEVYQLSKNTAAANLPNGDTATYVAPRESSHRAEKSLSKFDGIPKGVRNAKIQKAGRLIPPPTMSAERSKQFKIIAMYLLAGIEMVERTRNMPSSQQFAEFTAFYEYWDPLMGYPVFKPQKEWFPFKQD